MFWTNLTAMIYTVPLVITALVLLFLGAFLKLASLADIRCPICRIRFGDVFDLRKHIKKAA